MWFGFCTLFQTCLRHLSAKRKLPLSSSTVNRNRGLASAPETQNLYILKRRTMKSGQGSKGMRKRNRFKSLRMPQSHPRPSYMSASRQWSRRTQNQPYNLCLLTVKARSISRVRRKQKMPRLICITPQLHSLWFMMEETTAELQHDSQTHRRIRAPCILRMPTSSALCVGRRWTPLRVSACTLNHTKAPNAVKRAVNTTTVRRLWPNTWQATPGWNTAAMFVGRSAAAKEIWRFTWGFTLARSRFVALTVREASPIADTSKSTWEATQERGHIGAMSAANALCRAHTSNIIFGLTGSNINFQPYGAYRLLKKHCKLCFFKKNRTRTKWLLFRNKPVLTAKSDIYLQECELSQVQSEQDTMIQKNIL